MKDILPSLLLALCAIGMILVWETSPPESGTVLVVFAPGKTPGDLGAYLRAADASLVGTSKIPGGFLVSSRTSGLPERLKRQGALLVLNSNLNLGCAPPPAKASARSFQPTS